MKELIKKEELVLLRNSKVIESYPVLQEIIENLANSNLQQLNEGSRKILEDNYLKVLAKAKEEWILDIDETQYYMKSKINCQVCKHKNIKNVCVIKNLYTKKKLTVGTECFKKLGISEDINVSKILERNRGEKRLEHLQMLFPGIEKEIEGWNIVLNTMGILRNEKIAQEYIELGINIKRYFGFYIDGKTSDRKAKELFCEIERIMQEKKNEIKKMKIYVEIKKRSA